MPEAVTDANKRHAVCARRGESAPMKVPRSSCVGLLSYLHAGPAAGEGGRDKKGIMQDTCEAKLD